MQCTTENAPQVCLSLRNCPVKYVVVMKVFGEMCSSSEKCGCRRFVMLIK